MRSLSALICLLPIGVGCSSAARDGWTDSEWATIQSHSPLPPLPPDTTNKYADNAAAAKLGQKFFFDPAFSGAIVVDAPASTGVLGRPGDRGKIACAGCHEPPWMFDTRAMPNNVGIGAQYMGRNVTTVLNASYYKWKETDGVRSSTWADGLTDPEDQTSMHGNRSLVAHVIYAKYKDEYNAIFDEKLDPALDANAPDKARFPADAMPIEQVMRNGQDVTLDPTWYTAWSGMSPADQKKVDRIFVNFGKAVQAYLRLMKSENSPFDQYAAGNLKALTDQQKQGLKLFIGKAACEACHKGPIFSDNKFHNISIVDFRPSNPTYQMQYTEDGRYSGMGGALGDEFNVASEYSDDIPAGTAFLATRTLDDPSGQPLMPADSDKGKWRTKGLRECAQTAPYEHTGQLATLADVVAFDNKGGDPAAMYASNRDPLFVPLNLTPTEAASIVAFLQALTGDPPPAALSHAP